MLIGATVLYAVAGVLALLASIGVGQLGPFGSSDLAVAFLAAGLVVCHAIARAHV